MAKSRASNATFAFSNVFYGYWVLGVAFLGIFIFGGCGVGAFSLFVQPLQTEFNWSRGQIMFGFSLFFLLNGLGGAVGPFLAGYLYDTRHSYDLPFAIFLATYVVALAAVLRMRPSLKQRV